MVTKARVPLGAEQLQEGIEQGYAGLDVARAAGVASLLRIRMAKRRTLARDLRKAEEADDAPTVAALGARIEQNGRLIAALLHDQAVSTTPAPEPRPDAAVVHGYVWRGGDDAQLDPAPKMRVAIFLARGDRLGDALTEDFTQGNGYFQIAVPLRQSLDRPSEPLDDKDVNGADLAAILAVFDPARRDPLVSRRLALNPQAVIFCELIVP